jgi:hypothetical protein
MLAFTNIILCNSNGLAVNELIKELTFDEGVAIRYPPPDINVSSALILFEFCHNICI